MSRKELVKRYCVFIVGLILNSFGVAFVTNAELGTSPIAAIPYSLSMILTSLSLGTWVIIFNVGLVAVQFTIQRKEANKFQIVLEVIIAFFFGYGIDLSMLCLQALHPTAYIFKLISLVAGCCIIAFGAYLEVIADVVMLPGDAFVRAIAKAVHKEYGGTRMCSDITMSVIAGVLCLIFLHQLSGVREGTIISALLVGNLVKLYSRLFSGPAKHILPEKPQVQDQNSSASGQKPKYVITISREYGSGGRKIGKEIANALNIAYYDSELIYMAAEKSGYTQAFVESNEEQMSRFQYNLYSWYTPTVSEKDIPRIEQLFSIEQKIIKEIASDTSCVIVGRLANFILGDHENTFHIFISSDLDTKIKRIMKRDGLSAEEARKKAQKVDRERATHCRYFTHKAWGKADHYDIAVKSSKYGLEKTALLLADMIRRHSEVQKDSSQE